MNYKILLINTLLLLYWESQLDVETGGDRDLLKKTLGSFNIPASNTDSEMTQETYRTLQSYLYKIVLRGDTKIEKNALIRDLRILLKEDPELVETIIEEINQEYDQTKIREVCINLTLELREYHRSTDFFKMFRERFGEIVFNPAALMDGDFNLNRVTQDILSACEPYALTESESVHNLAGVMDFVDFGELEDLQRVFTRAKLQVSPEEIIKFPWKAMNRMFGVQGGGRRGEMILVAGLQHHGKSLVSMAMTMSAALFNKPVCNDPNKEPAVVLMSTENDFEINVKTMYKMLVEPVLRKKINIADIDPNEAAEFVQAKFAENGVRFFGIRVNPDECGYTELQNIVLNIEAKGYEIIVMTCDYLGMLSTRGLYNGGITGRDKQALFKRVRNLIVKHRILFITPHQLSTEALQIERDEPKNMLDRILNRAFYHDCKTIAQEVDFEMNIQKIKVDGVWYLYFGRGKHRGVDDTPEVDMRFAIPFSEFGLIFDIDGEDSSCPKPGAGKNSEGGGAAWHQMAAEFEMES